MKKSHPRTAMRPLRFQQAGAAILIGVILLVILVLAGLTIAFYLASHKEQPKITYQPPAVSADDKLSAGKTNNELSQDVRIIAAGLQRDKDQRATADNVLADQLLVIGDTTSDPATSVEKSRLSSLQTTFISESDRRLKALTTAQQLLPKLTDDQRPSSNKQLSNEITLITGLKAKAASDSSLETFAVDKDLLDKEYGQYLLAVIQVYLLVWANSQTVLEDKVNILAGKFQERLNDASDQGLSTATAQTFLNTLQGNKATAIELTTKALASTAVVMPYDYNANRSVLHTYFAQMSTAHDQLANAQQAANGLANALAKVSP